MATTNVELVLPASDKSSDAKAAEERPARTIDEQRREDWYHLFEQMRLFLDQKPSEHPLYEPAVSSIRKKESLDYYRGLYDGLVGTVRFVDVARGLAQDNAKANGMPLEELPADAHEAIVVDMLKLQIGIAMSRMLKRWPDKWTPQLARSADTSTQ